MCVNFKGSKIKKKKCVGLLGGVYNLPNRPYFYCFFFIAKQVTRIKLMKENDIIQNNRVCFLHWGFCNS